MVDNYIRSMKREQQSGDEDRDENEGQDQEERDQAVRRLKTFLLVEGVRKKADISVSEEELNTFVAERAEQSGVKLDDLKRSGRIDDLRREFEEKKVFDLLGEKANIKEEKV